MKVLVIDVNDIEEKDFAPLIELVDMTPVHQEVHILKLSKKDSEASNLAKVKRFGIPYSDIKFVDFDDYSLRCNDKFDKILEYNGDAIVITKDMDLAVMLHGKVAGVFMY